MVLDIVAGPKPHTVSLGKYEQVCGIEFASKRHRRETTVLGSSMVELVRAYGEAVNRTIRKQSVGVLFVECMHVFVILKRCQI